MKTQDLPLSTHLAILQQAEYDLDLYNDWVQSEHVLTHENLSELQPEKATKKLKLLRAIAQASSSFMAPDKALSLAVKSTLPFEKVARDALLLKAKRHLRSLQEKGLVVIGIAGSYGKTSVKHELRHFLSTQHFTLMSPASYNTPLGLASSILKLTSDHDVFIAEMGEYQPGDIAQLLELLQPDIGVLTPVGFAHSLRFGTKEALLSTFAELWQSAYAPALILCDDANKNLFHDLPKNIFWYGEEVDSDLVLKKRKHTDTQISGELHFQDGSNFTFESNLTETTQVRNCLPAFLIQQSFQQPINPLLAALEYVPTVSRRLEWHNNPNGTAVIDNSYNTNPGSWQAILPKLTSLSKSGLTLLTPGFVELEDKENIKEHEKMAQDLLDLKATVGVIKTRFNQKLIEILQKKLTSESLFIGDSCDDLIAQLSQSTTHNRYLWLEGGVRELYQ